MTLANLGRNIHYIGIVINWRGAGSLMIFHYDGATLT